MRHGVEAARPPPQTWTCRSRGGKREADCCVRTTQLKPEAGCPDFPAAVRLFFEACPGPPMLRLGIRVAALQLVKGIPGLDASRRGSGSRDAARLSLYEANEETRRSDADRYLCSVVAVAKRLKVRPGYLSETAVRHGFSYSRALRWIRYLHAATLLAEGHRLDTVARRLGFCDVAGWSRFTVRLLGRSPSQLPVLPLQWWVRKAVDDVFFGIPVAGAHASPTG